MAEIEITADGPIWSRLSIEYVDAAGADWFKTSLKDRTDGSYVGREVRIIGGDVRRISSYSSGRYYVDAPWTSVPTPGMTGYEIHAGPTGSGDRWRQRVLQWASPIGNGSGGALVTEYDRSTAGDWSDPVVMETIAPRGTPGQNRDDTERTFHGQVFKFVTTNDLRTPPRPKDGNLFVPAGSHTGTDGSNLDVGPELVWGRLGVIPAAWSIMLNEHQDAPDQNGNLTHYFQRYYRTMGFYPDGSPKVDQLLRLGSNAWKFIHRWDGAFGREDDAGNFTNLTTSGAPGPAGPVGPQGAAGVKGPPGDVTGVTAVEAWAPRFAGSTVAGSNSYSMQSGWWYADTRQVYFGGRISMSNKDGSMAGNVQIHGLDDAPVSISVSGVNFSAVIGEVDFITLSSGYVGNTAQVLGGTRILTLGQYGSGVGAIHMPVSALGSNATFIFQGSYPYQ